MKIIYNKSSQQSFVKIAKCQVFNQKKVKIMFLNEMGVKCKNKSQSCSSDDLVLLFVCILEDLLVCLFVSFFEGSLKLILKYTNVLIKASEMLIILCWLNCLPLNLALTEKSLCLIVRFMPSEMAKLIEVRS